MQMKRGDLVLVRAQFVRDSFGEMGVAIGPRRILWVRAARLITEAEIRASERECVAERLRALAVSTDTPALAVAADTIVGKS